MLRRPEVAQVDRLAVTIFAEGLRLEIEVERARDNDSVVDTSDLCPRGDTGWTSNPTTDNDSDGCRDSTEDDDDDNDLVDDPADNCPLVANAAQENAAADALGDLCDLCIDTDGDGFGDSGYPTNTCATDNCPTTPNASQANADGDSDGDACDLCTDPDDDGFGSAGFSANTCPQDNCPDTANPGQEDGDRDGDGDACDDDSDGDGLDDVDEVNIGTNPLNVDSDGDSISDAHEVTDVAMPEDTDNDQTIDALDDDSDSDGLSDIDEAGDGDVATGAAPSGQRRAM